jgi:hypothetical protein
VNDNLYYLSYFSKEVFGAPGLMTNDGDQAIDEWLSTQPYVNSWPVIDLGIGLAAIEEAFTAGSVSSGMSGNHTRALSTTVACWEVRVSIDKPYVVHHAEVFQQWSALEERIMWWLSSSFAGVAIVITDGVCCEITDVNPYCCRNEELVAAADSLKALGHTVTTIGIDNFNQTVLESFVSVNGTGDPLVISGSFFGDKPGSNITHEDYNMSRAWTVEMDLVRQFC